MPAESVRKATGKGKGCRSQTAARNQTAARENHMPALLQPRLRLHCCIAVAMPFSHRENTFLRRAESFIIVPRLRIYHVSYVKLCIRFMYSSSIIWLTLLYHDNVSMFRRSEHSSPHRSELRASAVAAAFSHRVKTFLRRAESFIIVLFCLRIHHL